MQQSHSKIEIISPFVPAQLKGLKTTNEKVIVVYFSDFFGQTISQSMQELIPVFSRFPEFTFRVYDSELETSPAKNIEVMKRDRSAFLYDLSRCTGVISTAGHTLISECFYLGKPIFAIPIVTYDQHYCAWYIHEHKFGVSSKLIDDHNLGDFISSLEAFTENILSSPLLKRKADGGDRVMQYITQKEWQR